MSKWASLWKYRNFIISSHFEFEPCHRVYCKCLVDLKDISSVCNTMQKYKKYKRCHKLSKHWDKHWPK